LCTNVVKYTILKLEKKNKIQGISSENLCSLAGRYDKPNRTRFLAPQRLFKNSSTVSTLSHV
jgi:hypothetical protein